MDQEESDFTAVHIRNLTVEQLKDFLVSNEITGPLEANEIAGKSVCFLLATTIYR